MNDLTSEQQMFLEIMCVWMPIVVCIGLNVVFILELLGLHRAPKGMFNNIVAVLMVGPTAMVIVIVFFIYKAIEFKLHKKRIEDVHEKNKNHINFFE